MRRVTWTFLSQHAQIIDYDGKRLVLGIATVGLVNTFRAGNHAELVRQAKQGQTWDPGWFAHFRDAGWTGALVPTAFGGLDLDPLSIALIFEELGRGAVPSPLLASSAIAACLLLACQQSERRDAALTTIADGGIIARIL